MGYLKSMKLLFVFFILVSVSSTFAQTEADLQKWSQSEEWIKLLHYKTSEYGTFRSLVDGPEFFFAEDGKYNAFSELKASLAAMSNSDLKVGKYKLHPQCAFPARYWFLKNKVGLKVTEQKCPKVDEFLDVFKDPQTLSVVFSSAYPNNPASMFGHSFIKINSKKRADITDIGINFAAKVADDENPFAFIYFGITGGYLGLWSTESYHNKIKEYVQGENRDLWEYELNLTADETRRFLYHLWELETNSYFYYYFFDENCSYQILAALEAIKPEWNLTDYTVYVIPGESIKNLFKTPGIVKNVHFRPSIQKQVLQKYKALNETERSEFFDLIDLKSPSKESSPLALETAMLYFDFLNIKQKGELSAEERKQNLAILSQRASLGQLPQLASRLEPIIAETRPDLGHDSYSLSVSQTFRSREDSYGNGGTTNIKFKTAYHDLMNNDIGFKRYSHIDFPGFEFQYDYDLEKFRLDNIIGLNITSLPPINFLSKAPSWKIESGMYTPRDYGCLTCRHVFLKLGIGGSFNLLNEFYLAYALATIRGEAYDQLSRGYRYGPGLDVGILVNPTEKTKYRLAFEQFWDVDQNIRSESVQYYVLQNSYFLSRNHELRSTLNWIYPKGTPDLRQLDAKIEFTYFFN